MTRAGRWRCGLWVAVLVGLAGCDFEVDRTNPYDPANENAPTRVVTGSVTVPQGPGGTEGPSPDCTGCVWLVNTNQVTDIRDRQFRFSAVRPGRYQLLITAPRMETFAQEVEVARAASRGSSEAGTVSLGPYPLRPIDDEARLVQVQGRVRRKDANQHADIEVFLDGTGRSVRTDPQGRFQIIVFPDVVNRICARAEGYRFRQEDCATLDLRTGSPPTDPIDLGELEAEAPSLVLSVVPPPGVPIDQVQVRYHNDTACESAGEEGLAFTYGVPFPGRHYLSDGLPTSGAGVITLRNAATSPVCFPIRLTPSAQTRDLGVYTLQPLAPVRYSGRLLVRGTETAIADADVRVQGSVISTDREGRFTLRIPAAEEDRVATLSVVGFYDSDELTLPALPPGEAHDLGDVSLQYVPATLSFTVAVDQLSENAATDMRAVLTTEGGGREELRDPMGLTFEFRQVAPNLEQTLTITRPGYLAHTQTVRLRPMESRDLGTVILRHGSTTGSHKLTGRIVDALTGQPLPDAHYEVRLNEPQRRLLLEAGRPNGDGVFSVAVAPVEEYQLTLTRPDHQPWTGTVRVPDEGAGVQIVGTGEVLDTFPLAAEPLNGQITVQVAYANPWLSERDPTRVVVTPVGGRVQQKLVSPEEGEVRFDNLERGLHLVRFERAGFEAQEFQVWLRSDARAHAQDATLRLTDLTAARPTYRPDAVLPGEDLRPAGAPAINVVGADLAGLRLSGDFSGVDLRQADLSGARIDPDTRFVGTLLQGANLFQTQADGVDFSGANLRGARLSSGQFREAVFIDAVLVDADATGANLAEARFVADGAPSPAQPCPAAGADQQEAVARTGLAGIRLTSANLANAGMTGVNLFQADLGFAQLDGTRLDGACLTQVDLTLARLRGTQLSQADLSEASLVNAVLEGTDLRGANLQEAVLFGVSMESADLGCFDALGAWPGEVFCRCPDLPRGDAVCPAEARNPLPWDRCRTNLTAANLGGAVVSGTNFTGADLHSARLVGVDLSAVCAEGEDGAVDCDQRSRFTQADFTLAQLPGMLVGAVDLRGACFRDADLTSAEFSGQTRFTAADFRGATLEGARMDEADLRTARFDGAQMARAQLRSALAQGVRFDRADLRSAQLEDSNLTAARFKAAELHRVRMSPLVATGADFEGATLRGAELTFDPAFQDVRLDDAQMQGASLTGVVQRVDLRGADLSRTTTRAPLVVNNVSFQGATLDDARWTVDRVRGANFEDVTWTGGHLLGTDGSYGGEIRPGVEEALEGPERCVAGPRTVPRTDTPFLVSSFDRASLAGVDLSGLDFAGTTFRRGGLTEVRFNGSDFDGSAFDDARGLRIDFSNARFGLGSFRDARLEASDLRHAQFVGTDLLDSHWPRVRFWATRMHRVRLASSSGERLDWSDPTFIEGLCVSASTFDQVDLSAPQERETRGGLSFNYSTVGTVDLTGHAGLTAVNESSTYEPGGIIWDQPLWAEGLDLENDPRVFTDPDLEIGLCQMARDACGPDGEGNPCPVVDFACDEYDENNTNCDMEWCGVARELMCDPNGELASLEARVNLPIVGEQVLELPLSALLDPCAFLVERNCVNSFGTCLIYAGARVSSDLSGDAELEQEFVQANLSDADLSGRTELKVSDVNFDGARLVGARMLTANADRAVRIRRELSFRDADLTDFDWGLQDANAGNDEIDLTGATVTGMRGFLGGAGILVDQRSAASRPFGSRIWMREVDMSGSPPERSSYANSDLRGLRLVGVDPIADGLLFESNLDQLDLSGSRTVSGETRFIIRDSSVRDGRFVGSDLWRVLFVGSALHGSRFDSQPDRQTRLVDADFTSSSMLYGSFIGADLTGATFEDFWLGNKDFTGAVFGPADLSGHDFSDATLDQVDLDGATLTDTTWFRVSAVNARLNGADLAGAWIAGTLAGAQLGPHDGQPANLTGAHLVNVELQGANLAQANLSGADLWGAQLQGANLTGTVIDGTTILVGALVCADAPGAFFERGAVLAEEGCE